MRYIIDRFEGEYAVCEAADGKMVKFHRSSMPADAKEGDVVQIGDSADSAEPSRGTVQLDVEETKKRRESIEKLADELWN